MSEFTRPFGRYPPLGPSFPGAAADLSPLVPAMSGPQVYTFMGVTPTWVPWSFPGLIQDDRLAPAGRPLSRPLRDAPASSGRCWWVLAGVAVLVGVCALRHRP